MKKLIWLLALVICSLLSHQSFGICNSVLPNDIIVEKSSTFKGKAMEALFVVKFDDSKTQRNFEVIKTNSVLQNYFLADYLLIEKSADNKMLYYPLGWTTSKITADEIKVNCMLIIKGKVAPVAVE
jgi:hypothetical protein